MAQDFRKSRMAHFLAKDGDKNLGLVQAARGRPEIDIDATVLEALDCLRVAITVFDGDERLVYCNAHYGYLFRSVPHRPSLLGATYEDLIRMELAGGEIVAPQNEEEFIVRRRRQLLDGDFRPLDIQLTDGRVLELKARRTREDGWIVLWSDATQVRRLLTRLEDTIELSVDAYSYWNEDDRLILCNTAFAQLHGLASAGLATGLTFQELTKLAISNGKFAIDGSETNWLSRRMDAHDAAAGALTISTSSGQSYLVRERAARSGGVVTVLTDISDRQRAESALAEQTRALLRTQKALQKSKTVSKRRASYLADLTRRLDAVEAEADSAKATFLRTMSHELKTPLNAIIGFADLLRSSPDRFTSAQVGEYAGLIHAAGGNLLRLINQILDLTKIASGRYPLRRTSVPVASAIATALDLNDARIAAKSHLVESVVSDIAVEADENALATMIAHLVENAASYTQAGGRIRITASREDDFVRITVADNGPGVAPDDLERIVEPFEQVGRGIADHSAGTGLGLPLVRALAELHGGSLSVESTLGQGLAASVDIPSA